MANKKRWDIQLEPTTPFESPFFDYRLIPKPEPLQKFIDEHVNKLCAIIAEKEEQLIIAALPSDALARLKAIVDEEFQARLGR
jgi:hypothetical protein